MAGLEETLGVRLAPGGLEPFEMERARRLEQDVYSRDEWTLRL